MNLKWTHFSHQDELTELFAQYVWNVLLGLFYFVYFSPLVEFSSKIQLFDVCDSHNKIEV